MWRKQCAIEVEEEVVFWVGCTFNSLKELGKLGDFMFFWMELLVEWHHVLSDASYPQFAIEQSWAKIGLFLLFELIRAAWTWLPWFGLVEFKWFVVCLWVLVTWFSWIVLICLGWVWLGLALSEMEPTGLGLVWSLDLIEMATFLGFV